ncbi:MAG: ABC transporter permease [Lachnospiraceae bacterium]|nr:ABC transporter permease [Lachnospiraceae bacterium]
MTRYIIKRVIMAVVTLFIITFLLFMLVRIMPGNPFPAERMSDEAIEKKRIEMGLNDPIPVQFKNYISEVLRNRSFGKGSSLYNGAPISSVLPKAMNNSFKIGAVAICFGVAVGLILGIAAALNRGRFWDVFCSILSIVGVCIPSYVFMIFLQYYFAYKTTIFPFYFNNRHFWLSTVMPALSLSLFSMSTVARFTRNEMVEVMDSDYVLMAESKGMFGTKLVTRHILRNALIPIVTVIAPLIVDLLTGALVVEKIYGINGIGKLMVDAITGEGIDYNYVLALGILYSAMYIGIMLVLDIVYCLLDPRIRVSGEKRKKKEQDTNVSGGEEVAQV